MGARAIAARIGLHIALLGFSTGIALLGAELTVQLVLPQYVAISSDDALFEPHPTLGWVGRPGARVEQGFDADRRVPVEINSRGFRDDETPYARGARPLRILVLGDSVAFGFGVRREDRFSEVIERTRPEVELVNLGVSGYSTDQELLLFRQEGVRFAPDGVVLVFVSNDAEYNGLPLGHGHPKPAVELRGDALVATHSPVPPMGLGLRVHHALSRSSALYNLARERLDAGAGAASPDARAGLADLEPASSGEAESSAQLTQRLVLALRDEARVAGSRFLVLVAVTDADLSRRAAASEALLHWCATKDVTCIDTQPAFLRVSEAEPGPPLFLQDRAHWTPRGHAIAAETLLHALVQQGWLAAR